MSTDIVTRRTFLRLVTAMTSACFCPALLADEARLHFIWWGSHERAALTRRVVKTFVAANPGVTVDTDYLEWLDYWQRFVTLVATRQTPDLFQMDYRYLALYAEHGILHPLDVYLGNRLKITSFGKHNIDSCRVNGELYGVNLGINSAAAIVDRNSWIAAGVEPPSFGTTWEAFSERCQAFAKANKRDNFYATPDATGIMEVFENWLRQKGKAVYDAKGQLNFEAADAVEWFEYWARIRSFGGCAPPDIQVLDKHSIQTSLLILGYTAMSFEWSNMFVNIQQRMHQPLTLSSFPVIPGGQPGHYYKPSQMLSIAASSKAPDVAVDLANFFVMSPQAVKILGVDRGIPAAPDMRKLLFPQLDRPSRETLAFIEKVEPFVGPLPPTPPPNAGEITIILQSIGHEIAFNRMTPKQGAEKLIQQASSILAA